MIQTLSASAPLSAAMGSTLPAAIPQDTPRFGPTLGQCLTDLKKAADEYKGHVEGAFVAGIRVGNAALTAQDLLPYGEFGKWVETNITSITPQWVRACMRAAEVMGYLEGHPQRDTVLETHRGLQNLAALLVPIEELKDKGKPGEPLQLDALIASPPKLKPKAAKLKIDRSPDAGKDEHLTESGSMADTITEALDARAKALDKREAALTAREKALDERERNLAMREARVNTDAPTDAKPRKPSSMALQPEGDSIDDLKAKMKAKAEKEATKVLQRAAAPAPKPKKASRKATPAAGSAQNEEGVGTPAPAEKTAPTQVDADEEPM